MIPWERQSKEVKGETIVEPLNAYDAFCIYYKLPPNDRCFEKVCELLNLTTRVIVFWATEWYWFERAEAFDANTLHNRLLTKSELYVQNLNSYSQGRKNIATGEKNFGLAILDKCRERLLALNSNEIPVTALPAYIKAGLELCNSGIDNEGKALGIDEISLMLDEKSNKKKRRKKIQNISVD